jgi:hypothetical protein
VNFTLGVPERRSSPPVLLTTGDNVPYLIKSCMGENTPLIATDVPHAIAASV